MFDVFEKYLGARIRLTKEEIGQIRAVSIIRKLRKKQYLLQEGAVWHYNAFVTKGCLRTYSVDEKGLEHITYFSIENWWTGDRESLLTGQPSRVNIDAIEDSEVLLLDKPDFAQLCRNIPVFNELITSLLDRSLVATQNRLHATITYTAEERYQEFLEKYPGFASRVPQHMIASYLGITAETLSRLRRGGRGKR